MSVYIRDSYTYDTVNPDYSYCAGKAFGAFESALSDIPDTLGETIPDFHNMELRARQLREAVQADAVGRMANPEVQAILKDLLQYEDEMCKAERWYREGKLPKRICHCDTKVSNMLFDKDGNVLCVIDLDTLMPSFVFSDFGDFMRTAANTVPEDDPAVEKVRLRMDIFEAFTKGYLEGATFLTPIEKENLPYAACLFPYMQAVRFFADYINGDTYYKIQYPDHNLVRTRNQVALFHSAYALQGQMKAYIDSPCFCAVSPEFTATLTRRTHSMPFSCQRGQNVAGGRPKRRRWKAKTSQVGIFCLNCDGKWPLVRYSVAGGKNFAHLRRKNRSPATLRPHTHKKRAQSAQN